jgi:hypothetical protein
MKKISLKISLSLLTIIGFLLMLDCEMASAKTTKTTSASTPTQNTVQLQDFDHGFFGFSFKEGKPVVSQGGISTNIDFVVDFPHGIASNNSKVAKSFKGQGGVFDISSLNVKSIKDLPKGDPKLTISLKSIQVGNQYLFLCADGKSYGKIKITEVNMEKKLIQFSWEIIK